MGYSKLRQSDSGGGLDFIDQQDVPLPVDPRYRRKNIILLTLLSLTLVIITAVGHMAVIKNQESRTKSNRGPVLHKTSHAISRTCRKARYPNLCVRSLLDVHESAAATATATELDLVHMSFNVTLQRFSKALYASSAMNSNQMDPRVRSAYEDCLELLDDSVDALSRSLTTVVRGVTAAHAQDVITWLSAAMTNHDTCTEGFEDVHGLIKDQMTERLKDLSKLVSNCLAIFSATAGEDFSGVPIQNKRRLMAEEVAGENDDGFPSWVGKRERRLLQLPAKQIPADIVVSKDGNGTVKTISEAIKKVPEYSSRRFVIYVRAGRYEEDNLKVGRKKTNVMIVGDGKGATVISNSKSVFDNMTTFHTAAFAATGAGFIAKDITFENWAGPQRHQAVALRVGADHAVVFRCNVIGYQDTLYVHSNRQFFRECDIYGTVDFVFGNAAVVLQNCSLIARKPMPMQKNTITAQNRKDPNQNTGISIHACRILATPDLQATNYSFQTYLGRPWKLYSRTVYMQSYIGAHVHPRGWLEWNATFALDTLYYGEYQNYGPGAALGQRVRWPGYRNITSPVEASNFTVKEFIFGSSWLPSTGVAFVAGLSV